MADDPQTPAPAATAGPPRIARGTREYRAVSIAFFSCGFNIFAMLYCTQSILPLLAQEFSVSAAESSLALSLTTIVMAVSMLFASSVSEAVGRKPLMLAALVASSLLTLVLAFSSQWQHVLWLRALTGLTLSGMPAVALAYLAEEMEPSSVPPAVGLYIGGGAVGGMMGRLIPAFFADYAGSWRMAMAAIAVCGLLSAIVFWRALAPSRHFVPRALSPVALVGSLLAHLRNGTIVLLITMGFLMLGSFMVLFNYIGFRLQGAPFHLSQAVAGLVFIVYPLGSFASAWMGSLAGRFGRGRVMLVSLGITIAGLLFLAPDSLFTLVLGLALVTFGFFGAHAIASGWAPALAEGQKAQASSLYLLVYYIGGGVAGTLGGYFWEGWGWSGVVIFSGAMMIVTFVLAAFMWRFAKVQ
ncbi:MAG: MFS transporter [Hyphomicrobiales bacterium]|nr:MFS transporter [Hyphomicrobiales bacterium]